jgi:hypothetical protein
LLAAVEQRVPTAAWLCRVLLHLAASCAHTPGACCWQHQQLCLLEVLLCLCWLLLLVLSRPVAVFAVAARCGSTAALSAALQQWLHAAGAAVQWYHPSAVERPHVPRTCSCARTHTKGSCPAVLCCLASLTHWGCQEGCVQNMPICMIGWVHTGKRQCTLPHTSILGQKTSKTCSASHGAPHLFLSHNSVAHALSSLLSLLHEHQKKLPSCAGAFPAASRPITYVYHCIIHSHPQQTSGACVPAI